MNGRKTIAVWTLVQLISGVTVCWAGPIKTLVMSGKVIEGHAKYEESCDKCHQPFSEDPQKRLCLKCHKNISNDLLNSMGFHGRIENIKKRKCKHCHTDHKGRSADIIMLDRDMFNHDKTDFIIRGGHTGVDCGNCHQKGEKHRNTPSECGRCHTNKDPHMGNLGEKCGDCHNEISWGKTKFDHRNVAFPLKGKHEKLSCSVCHPDKRFDEKLSNSCYTCHVVNDTHNGSFGEKCGDCHNEISWKGVKFTHEKLNFQLLGRHDKVKCNACHKGKSYKDKPGTSCFSCHENDDKHNEKFGRLCDRCHSVNNDWPDYTFDHNKTALPLLFRHTKVPCDSCHRLPLKTGAGNSCFDCHMKNDVHSGVYGKSCELCHSLKNSWPETAFDHDKTAFQLKGKHKKLKCIDCHKKKPEKEKLGTKCLDCHSANDIHKNQEGEKCERCHNENEWNEKLFFDHDLTNFPLIGIHTVTPCEDCHIDSAYKQTPYICYECHKSSDTHKERLGKDCRQCHTPNGWTLWTFSHKARTKFTLNGKHRKLKCVLCHSKVPEDSLKVSVVCIDCHSEDDKHRGRFGRACKKCHTTNSFKELNIKQ